MARRSKQSRARSTWALTLAALASCGGSSALLGPDAAQGVEGIALRGPLCPVASEANPCPDEPYEAEVHVLDQSRRTLGRFRTGADGRFRVGLEPGTYVLRPRSGDPFPVVDEVEVSVMPGAYTPVTLHFDTGIR